MVDTKEWVLSLGKHKSVKELVNEFQTNCEKLSKCFSKQFLPVVKAVSRGTATIISGTYEGAVFGLIVEFLYKDIILRTRVPPSSKQLASFGQYRPVVQSFFAGRNLENVRNFAVLAGVSTSINCVMNKIRGKEGEDVETCIVASFGSGVALSLVTGMRGPSVISFGVFFVLFNVGLYKLEKISKEISKSQAVHTKMRGINQCCCHCSERSQHPN